MLLTEKKERLREDGGPERLSREWCRKTPGIRLCGCTDAQGTFYRRCDGARTVKAAFSAATEAQNMGKGLKIHWVIATAVARNTGVHQQQRLEASVETTLPLAHPAALKLRPSLHGL